jgi:hypothetical protein
MTGCMANKNMVGFNPSNSMCLDSLVVNIQSAGCEVVSVEKEIYGISRIKCLDHNEKETDSSWLTEEFYAIAFGTSIPDNTIPICTDPFIVLTATNKE